MQARCLTQHAESTVHRVAQEVFLAPDKPISQCLPYSVADQSLFKGNVPQPQDWLRAWRACQTPSSFQSAMTFFGTDDYIDGESRGLRKHGCSSLQGEFHLFFLNCPAKFELAPVLPQLFGVAISGLANMILVMHWAVKKYRKERLLQASSISISIDDRKDYRVMRYRCDLPAAKFVAHSQQFSVHSPVSLQLQPLWRSGVSQSPWLWKVYLVFFAWVKMLQRTPSKATTRTRGSKWSKVSRSF